MVVKLGANGALAMTRDDQVIHVTAPVVQAVDTTAWGIVSSAASDISWRQDSA